MHQAIPAGSDITNNTFVAQFRELRSRGRKEMSTAALEPSVYKGLPQAINRVSTGLEKKNPQNWGLVSDK